MGILFGTSILFLITAWLNLMLYNYAGEVTMWVAIVGGTYIMYLGILMLIQSTKKDHKMLQKNLFLTAILLNFVNPKTIIFGLTVSTFYLELGLPRNSLYGFAILMGVLCYVSVILWGLLGSLLSKLLDRYQIYYRMIMSLLLFYSGLVIILEVF